MLFRSTKKTLHISDEEFQEGWRLACMSKIIADVEVLVPDIASAYKSRMKVADLSSKEEIAIFENAKREIQLAGIDLRNSLESLSPPHTPPLSIHAATSPQAPAERMRKPSPQERRAAPRCRYCKFTLFI